MPIIDPRGFNLVPDASGFSGQIGDIISQNIMQGLAQKAMSGDQEALSQLNVRNPGVGQRIGGILEDQRAQQEQQRKVHQDMAYRVARGYKTAKDKAGYLASASQQLRAAGLADMADEIDDDVATYAKNPAMVDQEYTGIYDMFNPDAAGSEMFAPMPAMDAQGNPIFVQGSRSGGLQQIGGFRPYQPTYQEKTAADIAKEREKAGIDVGKAGKIADINTGQAVDEQTQKGVNERQMTYIDAGISAAEQLPNYDRMIGLLDNVATGNAASLAQSAANIFGQASADYQELDSMMKQAILANIKQLGANPTEGERKFMLESTGDIRQSGDTLKRLIVKYKKQAETAKKRGERLAESRGDKDALDLIRGVDKGQPKTVEVDY